jgi:hypothetical protein
MARLTAPAQGTRRPSSVAPLIRLVAAPTRRDQRGVTTSSEYILAWASLRKRVWQTTSYSHDVYLNAVSVPFPRRTDRHI